MVLAAEPVVVDLGHIRRDAVEPGGHCEAFAGPVCASGEDLLQLIEQAAQRPALDLPPAHPGSGPGAPKQDDHLGMHRAESL